MTPVAGEIWLRISREGHFLGGLRLQLMTTITTFATAVDVTIAALWHSHPIGSPIS